MERKLPVQSGIIGLLLGAGCVAILLRQVDLKQSWNALGQLRGPYLLIPIGVLCVNLPLRAWRWQIIFPPSGRPSFWSCLTVLGIGNMANFLLPGRAGDLSRCALVGPAANLAYSSRALATLAVERVLDGFALIGMVLFAIWVLDPPVWVLQILRVAVALFGAGLLLLVVLRYRTHTLTNAVTRPFRWARQNSLEHKVSDLLSAFAEGLAAVDSWGNLFLLLLLTASIWTTEAAVIWGLAGALNTPVALKSAIVVSAVLGLGLMIPAAPGGLGTYELFGTKAFQLVGLSAGNGLALTVVIHAWVFVANIMAGMALLAAKGLTLAQLKTRIEDGAVPAVPAVPAVSAVRSSVDV